MSEEENNTEVETPEEAEEAPAEEEKKKITKKESKIPMIAEAEKAAERLEAATAKQVEIIEKLEEIEAKRLLGGRSEAGGVEIKREPTPAEYAMEVIQGKHNNEEN